jgi:sulfide:quinone oxidoreductase
MATQHCQVLIIGGGAAGISVAASLHKRNRSLGISILEPAEQHYYQPAFSLVGAGQYAMEDTARPVASLIPSGVSLIRAGAEGFRPDENAVDLSNGDSVTYDWLVVATGIVLDWDKVPGLRESLGQNGVCSNYSPEHAPYTWQCVQALKPGARLVFTQPPLPFKCPGAPQKAVYLTADYLRRKGQLKNTQIDYYVHGPAIFGVPYFARELNKVVARYGINAHYQHNLVAVDGPNKTATIEVVGGDDKGKRFDVPFDMLHAPPPQSPPAVVKSSSLANEAGFVEVDQSSLRHARYPNVFSLGDVCSAPNSKTAAAVRKQSPVVVKNLLAAIAGKPVDASYDGYASCPLTTAIGKVIMAEFIYGGKVTPTLPLNPSKERGINWWIKKTALPIFYWDYMLKGHERFLEHNKNFKSDV